MARILTAIRTLLRDEYREPPVHFHAGEEEHPEICYDSDCMRPRLHLA